MLRFFIASLLFLSIHFLQAQQLITVDSISYYNNKTVTICDHVAGTFTTKSDKPVTYLNLHQDYPNADLTVVIFNKSLSKFEVNPATFFKVKNICVTGYISIYKGKPQIIVNAPEQITLQQ